MDSKSDFLPSEIIKFLKEPTLSHNAESLFPKNSNIAIKEHPKQDKRFKYPMHLDKSALRGEEIEKLCDKIDKLPIESLIPQEYYVLKDDLKCHLEYDDHEPKSIEEARKNLIIFPTENPQSRDEVTYLFHTLDKMLENANWPDDALENCSVMTEADIDHMIFLINKLDSIYSIIFHELSRQVWASSEARSSVLLELRNRYMNLICKLPEELRRLTGNVHEQALKDRKLTNQIEEFQMAIKNLTGQLKEVKIRDIKVTEHAERINEELEAALQDSARSKTLLNEYHVLYDLQKQRLDQQMTVISNEKEEWSALAFALSLKISDESLLNTTKRLRLTTKKLFQLSQHFAIFLSDCDTVLTSEIHELSGKCLKQITQIHTETSKTMNSFHDLFHHLRERIEIFMKQIADSPDIDISATISWLTSITKVLSDENMTNIFSDMSLLNVSNYRAINIYIEESLEEWRILVDKLSNRYPIVIAEESVECSILTNFTGSFELIRNYLIDFSTRIDLIDNFEPFFRDLKSYISKIESKIKDSMDEMNNEELREFLFSLVNELYLEMFKNQELRSVTKNEDFSEFNQFYNSVQKFIISFSNTIDIFDSQLLKVINTQHSKITDWLIEALFLFSDMEHISDVELKFKDFSDIYANIVSINNKIFHYIIECTEIFILESEGESKKIELSEYTEENTSWTNIAEMLIKNIASKIEKELMNRRKKSEKEIETMSFENINDLINQIIAKTNDKNIFLAIDTVKNLQSEIVEIESRIAKARDKRSSLFNNLKEQQTKIKDFEEKIEAITVDYRELVKTE